MSDYVRRAEELAIEASEADGWEARAAALTAWGDAARHAGRVAESEEAFRTLLAEAEEANDAQAVVRARIGIANVHCARSRWDAAIAVLEPTIEETGERRLVARARSVLASACFNRGEIDRADALLTEALVTGREYEDASILVPALVSVGVVALARGDLPEAYARLTEGLGHAERGDDAHWAAMARSYLAIHAHLSDRTDEAASLYEESSAELRALHLRRALGLCELARATLQISAGRWAEARAALEAAVSGLAATCPDYEAAWQVGLALCDLASGDVDGYRQRVDFASKLANAAPARAPLVAAARALDEDRAIPTETGPAPRSIELALIERACADLESRAVAPTLVVEPDGGGFVVPASTRVVELSGRTNLRRLLVALAERHAEARGGALSEAELVARVWPGERLVARAAHNRLHNALSTLRRLGLKEWIERSEDGYRLRPDLVVRFASGGIKSR